MLLRRLYDDKLAQASYLIACEESGTALVVDPVRDIERYLAAAARENVTITDVAETHIHADFVSGARELAHSAGARLHLSGMGGSDWSYGDIDAETDLLHDGSTFNVGTVRVDVMHTPGHTPEHVVFLITDTTAANAPVGAVTGDFVFVGDVGRPDLLERAAGVSGTKESAARDLFRSLQRFKSLPDYLQLWPGHGPGSACGKALGAMPSSTLGYEKLFNWGLAEENEDAFVQHVLTGQPEPPAYFGIMKRINRDGAPAIPAVPPPDIFEPEVAARIAYGKFIIDTRPTNEFAAKHVVSSINIPYTKSFLTYSGSVLPYDRELYLIVAEGTAESVIDDLSLIGIDRIGGVYSFRSIDDLKSVGVQMQSTPQLTIDSLRDRLSSNGQRVLDVRSLDEWEHGHIPGAIHIPLGLLRSRLGEIPRNAEIVVHCQAGTRSAIAASILQQNGIKASILSGGFSEWERSGGDIERGEASEP
jgi:hydroxyacylglutathione hydrolase